MVARRSPKPKPEPEEGSGNTPISYSSDNQLLESADYVRTQAFIEGAGRKRYPRAYAALKKVFGLPLGTRTTKTHGKGGSK